MDDRLDRLSAVQAQFGLVSEFPSSFASLCDFLEGSQYQLVELMVHNEIWNGVVPEKKFDQGAIEFGLFPYWIHNPPKFIEDHLDKHPIEKAIWDAFVDMELPCFIDQQNYEALLAHARSVRGVVASDGTIYGDGKFEQFDANWLWTLPDYLAVRYLDERAPFSQKSIKPIALQSHHGRTTVRIGILGDWGTGRWSDGDQPQCPSQAIMDQLLALQPDYIVHLGDVYYAGTAGDFLPLAEEQQNLLDVWPAANRFSAGHSFALNSNHEMYSGAKGLFLALTDPRFAAQDKTSYFALQFGGWTVLGLDSAYFSKSDLYMNGSIGGADGEQGKWIASLGLDPAKTLVATHHNALHTDGTGVTSAPGSPQESLWDEVREALGGEPAYWYWGHVHNGIVYKTPNVNGSHTRCRCVGHSSIPFGKAWGLDTQYVHWFANDLNQAINNGVRVNNGFAVLDITDQGEIHESIWSQGDAAKPVWANDDWSWQG